MFQTESPKRGEEIAVMKTNMGEIKIRLFPAHAPKAVENFKTHAKNGYLETSVLWPAVGAGLVCAALGAWAAFALEVDLLRRLFGAFLIAVGVWELKSPGTEKRGPDR